MRNRRQEPQGATLSPSILMLISMLFSFLFTLLLDLPRRRRENRLLQERQEANTAFTAELERMGRHEEDMSWRIEGLRRKESDVATLVHQFSLRNEALTALVQELSAREAGLRQQESHLDARVREFDQHDGALKELLQGLATREVGLRKQEGELETLALRLSEQAEMLEEQVRQIQQRETNLTENVEFLLQRAATAGDVEQAEALRAVEQRLMQRDQEHQQRIKELERELQLKADDLEIAERNLEGARRDYARLEDDLNEAKQKIHELQQQRQQPGTGLAPEEGSEGATVHWSQLDVPDTFQLLIAVARVAFSGLRIADTALQRANELNSAQLQERWLQDTWAALGALHEYASAHPPYDGDFFRWCGESGSPHAWHADRVAGHESGHMSKKHRKMRTFDIDPDVDSSGRLEMQAHLKIQKGGGPNIPRLYFYDDTKGPTQRVHIGFLGPHHLVPNASEN